MADQVFLTGNQTFTGPPFPPTDDFIITDNGVGSNTVTLANGIDQLTLGAGGNNTITLGNGADLINVGGGSNTVTTGNGNSSIITAAGSNTLTVGTGSNVITLGEAAGGSPDTVTTAAGNSIVNVSAAAVSADTINGAATSGDGTTNQLILTTTGVMTPVGVKGFQSYQLANGGPNTLTLSEMNFSRLPGASITVIGGNGGNTVNAAALSAAHSVVVDGGSGTDNFTGGAGNDRFMFNPSNLTGDAVDGGTGSNTLELAAGSGKGTLSGLGSSFSNLGTVQIDANADWVFAALNPSAMETINIGAQAIAEVQGAVGAPQTFGFVAGLGTLMLDSPSQFAGTIAGFQAGETVDLAGTVGTGLQFANGVLTVTNGSTTVASLGFSGNLTTGNFGLSADGLGGTDITFGPGVGKAPDDFNTSGRSEVLFENTATGDTGYWTTNASGTVTGFNDLAPNANTAYSIVGVGDFDASGHSEVLFENKATGDTGYWTTNASGGAITGFHDLAPNANTAYSIVGVGDFDASGHSEVLFENTATGDTGYWTTTANGAVTGFHDLAPNANTNYSVVGVGDFDASGHDEVLFENKTTGDTGYWTTNANGAVTGFHDLAPNADTAYSIVGVGDFDGSGHGEVLFENKTTGDTGYWTTNANGAVTGFHDFANANTAYSVVGVGDFDASGHSEVLFENKTTGDTGYWITNASGAVTGFHDFANANTAYTISESPGSAGDTSSSLAGQPNQPVGAGNSQVVASGATIMNPTISGGTLQLASGALLNGPITFAAGSTGTLFDADQASLPDTVVGFSEGANHLSFAGENPTAEAAVVASAQFVNGNAVLTFPDHTSIVLVGVSHVNAGFFA